MFAVTPLPGADLRVVEQFTEHLRDPIGVDQPAPRLAWVSETDSRGVRQSGWHVRVTATAEKVVWDSGEVLSDSRQRVRYAGESLDPATTYAWRVRVRDQAGRWSEWSDTAGFTTGLFGEEDWAGAQWIGHGEEERDHVLAKRAFKTDRAPEERLVATHVSPLLRRTFAVARKPVEALLFVSGLGYADVSLNGALVGDRRLDPAQTSYDVRTLYSGFDVSDRITVGDNVIAVMLGNGFFGQDAAWGVPRFNYGSPRLRAVLRLAYDDGWVEHVVSDESWKTAAGPVIWNNVYGGETHDVREEIPGWEEAGFDDSGWRHVEILSSPGGRMQAQMLEPIRAVREVLVKRWLKRGDAWIADFGENVVGWVRLKVAAEAGAVIRLEQAEALWRDGRGINRHSVGAFATGLDQINLYVCAGTGLETWEPRFTYHGFQYAEIRGLPRPPTADTAVAVVVNTDLEPRGSFSSSDEHLNRMHRVSERTFLGNVHGFPEDCPHREKCGWLGDAHTSAEYAMLNFGTAALWEKYLGDIESNLVESRSGETMTNRPDSSLMLESDGGPSWMVPTLVAPGRRAAIEAPFDWACALILVPWYQYLHYGDDTLLRRHHGQMKDLMAYMMTLKDEQGIVQNGLGDWCPPRWDRRTNPDAMECDPVISANALIIQCLDILGQVGTILDRPEDAESAAEEARVLREAFNAAFWVGSEGTPDRWYGSQTATVQALQFGIVPAADRAEALRGLLHDVHTRHGGHHSTGIHGLRYLYTVLSDAGLADEAMALLLNPDFPSPRYVIDAGLTTWPERQWEWADSDQEWDRSLNHPFWCGFTAWFHEGLAGIRPRADAPGYAEFDLVPTFAPGLDWIEVSHDSPRGKIVSAWRRDGDAVVWQVRVPANATAHVRIPARSAVAVTLDGGSPEGTDGCEVGVWEAGRLALTLGSGTYQFSTQP